MAKVKNFTNPTWEQRAEMAAELLITVKDNPNEGGCSIVDWFKREHKMGIPVIDNIKVDFNANADRDSILVQNVSTGEIVFKIMGQKALVLGLWQDAMLEYLKIKVNKG